MYEKEAARGAARLDKVRPKWFLDIDLNTLDLQSSHKCVLGQTFAEDARDYGSDDSGFAFALGIDVSLMPENLQPKRPLRDISPSNNGFDLPSRGYNSSHIYDEWDALRQAWIDEINSRREAYKHGKLIPAISK